MKQIIKKLGSIMLVLCVILTMAPMPVKASEDGTITITQQSMPESLEAVYLGASPGTLSVYAEASNGSELEYRWCVVYSDGSSTGARLLSTYNIDTTLYPGVYEIYCEVRADGCLPVRSSSTTLTMSKAVYSGLASDTASVWTGGSMGNTYMLPNLPATDMNYAVSETGSSGLITGTPSITWDGDTWRWNLNFDTAQVPNTVSDTITLKINGGYFYEDSTFSLTVEALETLR